MRYLRRTSALLLILLLALSGVACTKEKAEAVKAAAQQFRNEASLAISQVRLLLEQTIALPLPDQAEMVASMEGSVPIDSVQLDELIRESQGVDSSGANAILEKELGQVEAFYTLLGQTFDNLPQGRLFAGDAVKASEAHAVRLTIQMVNLAGVIMKQPQLFLGRRAALIVRINQAKEIADEKRRTAMLQGLADEVARLAKDEANARNQAIAQCLKAAQAGKTLTQMIKDYQALTVADLLSIAGESLQTARTIGFQGRDLQTLLTTYQRDVDTIQKDPYWAPVLSATVTH